MKFVSCEEDIISAFISSNFSSLFGQDPLSALDPEVAEKVFHQCMLELLGGKTRLLVTNQLQCLSLCDTIIALGKTGKVLEQGKYEELMEQKNGEVTRLLRGIAPSRRNLSADDPAEEENKVTKTDTTKPLKQGKDLMTKEERQTGNVKLDVYLKYIKAGGGYLLFAVVFFFYMLSTSSSVVTQVWVSVWTADSSYINRSQTFYIVGYAMCSLLVGATAFIRSYGLARFGVRSSLQLHGDVLRSVLRAPMSFFDTTPTGRILSRFSKDMYTVDHEIADYVDLFVLIVLQLFVVMLSIVVVTPYCESLSLRFHSRDLIPSLTLLFSSLQVATILPVLAFLYISAMNYFRQVSRETKRLDA